MPTPGIRLGVDFGTSNTVAVVRWPDGRSRPLLFDGSPLLPSAVYAEPDGQIIVGRDAVHSARLEPARFEPNPKRRIDEGTVLLGEREVPVNELIAAVLRRVREEWTRTVGGVDPDVTVTFPASWGATRRLAIADAAATAGLGQVRLVPEPVAAAAYFTQVLGREVPVGSVVVVHDFGAGTFDASVVARTEGGFEVLAVDGRDDIGGVDVDNAVVAHIGTICEQRAPQEWQRLMSPQTVEDRRHRRLLWDDARVAKERLSRQPAADLTIPLLNTDVHLTREELERLARPLLDQTVRVTQGVMRWAKLSEGTIAGVFLVGGSSRMPLVATLLHRALGSAPVAIEQPELVVAEGSMLAGSTEIPASAAPAPGPTTGVMSQPTGFNWQQSGPGPAAPVPGPPAPAGAGAAAGVDGLLWPDAGSLDANANANAPVSATPMSAAPVSGTPSSAPPGSYPAGSPGSTPPGGYSTGPAGSTLPEGYPAGSPGSTPPGGHPVGSTQPGGYSAGPPPVSYPTGAPSSAPPASYAPGAAGAPAGYSPGPMPPAGHPGSTPGPVSPAGAPASGMPGSTPPGGYSAGPTSAPPSGYGAGPNSAPSAGFPASAPPAGFPVSSPPAGYSGAQPGFPTSAPPGGHPVSGPPTGYPGAFAAGHVPSPPVQERPVSGPPNRPVSSGRNYVSGGVPPEPATRYDEFGNPVRPGDIPPVPTPTRQRVEPARRHQPIPGGGQQRQTGTAPQPSGRGPFARLMITLFVLVLLILTPLTAGYVSYYLTTGGWPPPVDKWVSTDR